MNECVVSIHQPQYWPWLGLMDKIVKSDVHVALDDVQFHKRGFQHRTLYRVFKMRKSQHLTIPYEKSTRYNIICNVLLPADTSWYLNHLETIHNNYRKTPFFEVIFELVKPIYSKTYRSLADLNIAILRFLFSLLDIKTKLYVASDIGSDKKKDELMLDYTIKAGGTAYLSGRGAKKYMINFIFEERGIKLLYQEFTHPVYYQYCEGFVDGLFVLDMLFNIGVEETKRYIHTIGNGVEISEGRSSGHV